ncbi:O-methyltransferase [Fulvivirga sedimenti]|uniref:Class I SAM-dependent methyltransferase n=1 Tax=Fulvivirga sedimenti TaxID=2879465 RepID=A0A9X1HQ09_9BACT|nr:class I SAM-dependent methyltransferase [Fulvivirga sedimenti]MCA6074858.1 class I SAM-dependent methyltransferase [Fulvivirga sedimenti]MCA6076035.1 class I SAM-dependent methyltransferase [Fulvivirga sedimenti]MCA6077163.1 class I SAM-dependent methyltransferase [Fulvivirga sedimenti]
MFLRHWLLSTGRHSLHEPFIYDLYDRVICGKERPASFPLIEEIRQGYTSEQHIKLPTFGAISHQSDRSLRQIARDGSTTPQIACVINRLISERKYRNVLELGTSLGLTTLYLSDNPDVQVTTMEANPDLIRLALENFKKINRENISLIRGNIDDTLDQALKTMGHVDLAYIDANHRFSPTIDYFNKILHYVNEESIVILDDIHWSVEMSAAWNEIRQHDSVTMTIDFYRMGWVFFRPFRNVYHYRLELPGSWK